jgi:multidrug efflux pump subunit AcrA (membrane-fusion protein)
MRKLREGFAPAYTAAAIAVGAVTLLLLSGCAEKPIPGPESDRTVQQVRTATAKVQRIPPVITSFGSISFSRKIEVTAAVGGTAERVPVEVGDTVRRGEMLAELSNVQLEIREKKAAVALREAQAALELLKTELWRGKLQVERDLLSIRKLEETLKKQKRRLDALRTKLEDKKLLFDVDGITERELEELELAVLSAETDYKNGLTELAIRNIGFRPEDITDRGYPLPESEGSRRALLRVVGTETLASKVKAGEARVETANEELESVRLLLEELETTAPASGIVGSRAVEVGERVTADAKLFSILSDGEVHAVFPVSEDAVSRIRAGMKTEVDVPAVGGRGLSGTIARISPSVDPATGNIPVKAKLTDTEAAAAVKPGMYAEVTVYTGDPVAVITVPGPAVVGTKDGPESGRVYVVVGGRAFVREVNTGREIEGDVEIVEGLEGGETVIVSPSLMIRDGDRVESQKEDNDGFTQYEK